jgi:hypothetical protein
MKRSWQNEPMGGGAPEATPPFVSTGGAGLPRPTATGSSLRLASACLALVCAVTMPAGAAATADALFAQAAKAYDAGQFDQAVTAYREILDAGFTSPALFHNLANAHFRGGRVGPAVLNYRRALYLAPRDPDVVANLRFALEAAGVEEPPAALAARLLRKLGLEAWIRLAIASFWLAAAAGCWVMLAPRRRAAGLRILAVLGAMLAVSLGGIFEWLSLHRRPEVVVTQPAQQALFAPLEGSTAHFAVPEGSILRMEGSADGWIKVTRGKDEGWVRAETCERVYPFSPKSQVPGPKS